MEARHTDTLELGGSEEEGGQAPCCVLILTALICHAGSSYTMAQSAQGLRVHSSSQSKPKRRAGTRVGGERGQGGWGWWDNLRVRITCGAQRQLQPFPLESEPFSALRPEMGLYVWSHLTQPYCLWPLERTQRRTCGDYLVQPAAQSRADFNLRPSFLRTLYFR